MSLEPITACYFCEAPLGEPLFATTYTGIWDNAAGQVYRYHRCAACDVVLLADRPARGEALARFYAERGGCSGLRPDAKWPMSAYVAGLQAHKWRIMAPHVTLTSASRILEIGAGTAAFAASLRTRFGCEAHATDLGLPAVVPPNVAYHPGEFPADAPWPDGHFDLVVAHQVIEHVYDPVGFLAGCARLLRPGGVLVLETVNHRCQSFAWFGADWGQLCPPRHTVIFSDGFLARQQPGLDVPTVLYDGHVAAFSPTLLSVLQALHLPIATSALARGVAGLAYLVLNPLAWRLERAWGGRAIVTAIARKPMPSDQPIA